MVVSTVHHVSSMYELIAGASRAQLNLSVAKNHLSPEKRETDKKNVSTMFVPFPKNLLAQSEVAFAS